MTAAGDRLLRAAVFARLVFRWAGVYGLLVLLPGYFLEATFGREHPPVVTHPEFYYGFTGVAIAWQVVFLILASEPLRYRPFMVPAVLEKWLYAGAVAVLAATRGVPGVVLFFAAIDAVLGLLFLVAFLRTGPLARA